jgi:hypothetical protein
LLASLPDQRTRLVTLLTDTTGPLIDGHNDLPVAMYESGGYDLDQVDLSESVPEATQFSGVGAGPRATGAVLQRSCRG